MVRINGKYGDTIVTQGQIDYPLLPLFPSNMSQSLGESKGNKSRLHVMNTMINKLDLSTTSAFQAFIILFDLHIEQVIRNTQRIHLMGLKQSTHKFHL